MEDNLDFLSEILITYSNVLLEIGLQWIELYPNCDPEEFLDEYLPSRTLILDILKTEHTKIKNQSAMIHGAIILTRVVIDFVYSTFFFIHIHNFIVQKN